MTIPATQRTAAFRLIYQVLSKRPSTFQELVDRSLIQHQLNEGKAETEQEAAKNVRALLGRGEPAPKQHSLSLGSSQSTTNDERLTQNHPFHSTSYLRRQILPVLESQELISIRHVPAGSRSAEAQRAKKQHYWEWALRPLKTLPNPKSPGNEWTTQQHWDRLLKGEHPGKLYSDREKARDDLARYVREKEWERGVKERPEYETWDWEDRSPELSTPLQRLHLNRRNRKKREEKEQRLMDLKRRREEAKKEAERLLAAQQAEAQAPKLIEEGS